MGTVKTILRQLGEYKRASILTPLLTMLEVVMDTLIPFVIARLIDQGIQARNMAAVW